MRGSTVQHWITTEIRAIFEARDASRAQNYGSKGNNEFFLAIMKILSGVHQGMRAETGIKVSTLFGLMFMYPITTLHISHQAIEFMTFYTNK